MMTLTISEEMKLYLLGAVKQDRSLGHMSNAQLYLSAQLIEILEELPQGPFTDGHGNDITHLIGEAND